MAKTPEQKAADKAAKEAAKAQAEAATAPTIPATVPEGAVPEATEAPAKPVKGEIVVRFRDHQGEPTERTFSKEVHGDDFAKLAEEFKVTNATKLI
jgi:hypothetical protein